MIQKYQYWADLETPKFPVGLCQCGCGASTKVSGSNHARDKIVKGLPKKFVAGHHSRLTTPAYRIENRGYKTPCWTWLRAKNSGGYALTCLDGRCYSAHRKYYKMHRGPLPDGLDLDHLCRNRDCVNPDHLEPVTETENIRRGRATKLTKERVLEIRALFGSKTHAEIALLYSVSKCAIDEISCGRKWADIR